MKNRNTISSIEKNILTRKKLRSKTLKHARDIILLSMYTGLSFADIMKLSYSSLILDDEGGIWIKLRKTLRGAYEVILLIQEAKVILDSYIPPFHPDNDHIRLMPMYSSQKMKAYLKEIGEMCGIRKTLTLHLGKYSFHRKTMGNLT